MCFLKHFLQTFFSLFSYSARKICLLMIIIESFQTNELNKNMNVAYYQTNVSIPHWKYNNAIISSNIVNQLLMTGNSDMFCFNQSIKVTRTLFWLITNITIILINWHIACTANLLICNQKGIGYSQTLSQQFSIEQEQFFVNILCRIWRFLM